MQEKAGKKPEKIFKKKANRHSVQVLPFYIVDHFMKNHEPVTAKMLQRKLLETGKGFYDLKYIRFMLNNLHHYCASIQLHISRPRVPGTDSHATAFSVKKILANELEKMV